MISQTGAPVTLSGTATTTWTNVSIVNPQGVATFAREISIRNDGTSGSGPNLLVSLNGGTTSITIEAQAERTIKGPVTYFAVQSASSTAAWSAIVSTA